MERNISTAVGSNGEELLLVDGYSFKFKRIKPENQRQCWTCTVENCNAVLEIDTDMNLTDDRNVHCHPHSTKGVRQRSATATGIQLDAPQTSTPQARLVLLQVNINQNGVDQTRFVLVEVGPKEDGSGRDGNVRPIINADHQQEPQPSTSAERKEQETVLEGGQVPSEAGENVEDTEDLVEVDDYEPHRYAQIKDPETLATFKSSFGSIRYDAGGDRIFVCNICPKPFETLALYRDHMRVHTGCKPYQCPKCDKSFAHLSNLYHHLKSRIHTTQPLFPGSHTSENNEGLLAHVRKVHTRDSYQCEYCTYKTSRKLYLSEHLLRHMNFLPYECDKCEFRTTAERHLKSHMRGHSTKENFKCNHCEFQTSSRRMLRSHARCHTTKRFYCNKCDFYSPSSSGLECHMRSCYGSGRRLYQCSFCDYSTPHTLFTLKRHMKTHKDLYVEETVKVEKKKVEQKEEEEGKEEEEEAEEDEVVVVVQNKKKRFLCPMCHYYSTFGKSDVRRHLKVHKKKKQRVDVGDRPKRHECSFCVYSTDRADRFEIHLNEHKSKKRNRSDRPRRQCPHCLYSSNDPSNFRKHSKIHEQKGLLCSEAMGNSYQNSFFAGVEDVSFAV